MPTAEWYRRLADECVSSAKMAIMNEERARLYALAERYIRLAMDELKTTERVNGAYKRSRLAG
jgi:hypothetical protein